MRLDIILYIFSLRNWLKLSLFQWLCFNTHYIYNELITGFYSYYFESFIKYLSVHEHSKLRLKRIENILVCGTFVPDWWVRNNLTPLTEIETI